MSSLYSNTANLRSSQHVSFQILNEIISSSQSKVQAKQFINKNMNAFSSLKVNSLMNEIGQLIHQKKAHQSNIDRKYVLSNNSIMQFEQQNPLPKDNMFTNGVKMQMNQSVLSNQFQIYQSFEAKADSVKYRTSLSSSSFRVEPDKQTRPKVPNGPPVKQKRTKHKVQIQPQLIRPSPSKTAKLRKLVSEQQESRQKAFQSQIQQYRDEKRFSSQQRLKNIQKQIKFNNLLNKDQIILCFDYQGEFLKTNKIQFARSIQKRSNKNLVQSIIQIKDHGQKFWKQKNNTKANFKKRVSTNQTQINLENLKNHQSKNCIDSNFHNQEISKQSRKVKQIYQNTSSTNQRILTINSIGQLKNNSIQITKKTKITQIEQKKQNVVRTVSSPNHKNTKNLLNISHNYQNKIRKSEHAKAQTQQKDFKSNQQKLHFLQKYHQDGNNFIPQWQKKVQQGCKLTIYTKSVQQNIYPEDEQINKVDRKDSTNIQANRSSKKQQYLNRKSDRLSTGSYINQNKSILQGQFKQQGQQIKSPQSLKNPQRTQKDLIQEWEKRNNIQRNLTELSKTEDKRKSKRVRKNSVSKSNLQTFTSTQSNTQNLNMQKTIHQNRAQQSPITNSNHQKLNKSPLYVLNHPISQKQQQNSSNTQECHKTNQGITQLGQIEASVHQNCLQNNWLKSKVNLNRKQFQKVKICLVNNRNIVRKNKSIQNQYSTDNLKHQIVDHSSVIQSAHQKQHKSLSNMSANKRIQKLGSGPINRQSAMSTYSKINVNSTTILTQLKRDTPLDQPNKYINPSDRPRSFSFTQERQKHFKSPAKYNITGIIRVNNQKLKSSLLQSSVQSQLHRRWSLLYKKLDQKASHSQKILLPINSVSKTVDHNVSFKLKNKYNLVETSDIRIENNTTKRNYILLDKTNKNNLRTNLMHKFSKN